MVIRRKIDVIKFKRVLRPFSTSTVPKRGVFLCLVSFQAELMTLGQKKIRYVSVRYGDFFSHEATFFSHEATFSFVGVAYHISKCDADKGKSRFARKKSPSGKRA